MRKYFSIKLFILARYDHSVKLVDAGQQHHCTVRCFFVCSHGYPYFRYLKPKIGAGFFGGEGFILQQLQGDGNVFIHAGELLLKGH